MTNDTRQKKYENKGFKFSVCPNNGDTIYFAKRNSTFKGKSWTDLFSKLPKLSEVN